MNEMIIAITTTAIIIINNNNNNNDNNDIERTSWFGGFFERLCVCEDCLGKVMANFSID